MSNGTSLSKRQKKKLARSTKQQPVSSPDVPSSKGASNLSVGTVAAESVAMTSSRGMAVTCEGCDAAKLASPFFGAGGDPGSSGFSVPMPVGATAASILASAVSDPRDLQITATDASFAGFHHFAAGNMSMNPFHLDPIRLSRKINCMLDSMGAQPVVAQLTSLGYDPADAQQACFQYNRLHGKLDKDGVVKWMQANASNLGGMSLPELFGKAVDEVVKKVPHMPRGFAEYAAVHAYGDVDAAVMLLTKPECFVDACAVPIASSAQTQVGQARVHVHSSTQSSRDHATATAAQAFKQMASWCDSTTAMAAAAATMQISMPLNVTQHTTTHSMQLTAQSGNISFTTPPASTRDNSEFIAGYRAGEAARLAEQAKEASAKVNPSKAGHTGNTGKRTASWIDDEFSTTFNELSSSLCDLHAARLSGQHGSAACPDALGFCNTAVCPAMPRAQTPSSQPTRQPTSVVPVGPEIAVAGVLKQSSSGKPGQLSASSQDLRQQSAAQGSPNVQVASRQQTAPPVSQPSPTRPAHKANAKCKPVSRVIPPPPAKPGRVRSQLFAAATAPASGPAAAAPLPPSTQPPVAALHSKSQHAAHSHSSSSCTACANATNAAAHTSVKHSSLQSLNELQLSADWSPTSPIASPPTSPQRAANPGMQTPVSETAGSVADPQSPPQSPGGPPAQGGANGQDQSDAMIKQYNIDDVMKICRQIWFADDIDRLLTSLQVPQLAAGALQPMLEAGQQLQRFLVDCEDDLKDLQRLKNYESWARGRLKELLTQLCSQQKPLKSRIRSLEADLAVLQREKEAWEKCKVDYEDSIGKLKDSTYREAHQLHECTRRLQVIEAEHKAASLREQELQQQLQALTSQVKASKKKAAAADKQRQKLIDERADALRAAAAAGEKVTSLQQRVSQLESLAQERLKAQQDAESALHTAQHKAASLQDGNDERLKSVQQQLQQRDRLIAELHIKVNTLQGQLAAKAAELRHANAKSMQQHSMTNGASERSFMNGWCAPNFLSSLGGNGKTVSSFSAVWTSENGSGGLNNAHPQNGISTQLVCQFVQAFNSKFLRNGKLQSHALREDDVKQWFAAMIQETLDDQLNGHVVKALEEERLRAVDELEYQQDLNQDLVYHNNQLMEHRDRLRQQISELGGNPVV